jgi:plasmid stability protein
MDYINDTNESGQRGGAFLSVHGLDNALIRELRIRAARHRCAAVAEHRLILEEALRQPQRSFKSIARRLGQSTLLRTRRARQGSPRRGTWPPWPERIRNSSAACTSVAWS